MAIPAILTTEWLKQVYLFGVTLHYKGTPYPKSLYEQGMVYAIDAIETRCDIKVRRERIADERQDYTLLQWDEFAFMELDEVPVQAVNSLKFYFGAREIYEVPSSWLRIMKQGCHVQIIPSTSDGVSWKLQQLFFQSAMFLQHNRFVPQFYSVDYTAGFDIPWETYVDAADGHPWIPMRNLGCHGQVRIEIEAQSGDASRTFEIEGLDLDGNAATETLTVASASEGRTTGGFSQIDQIEFDASLTGEVRLSGTFPDPTNKGDYNAPPRDIVECIGKLASLQILHPAGDLISGAGIASLSASLDGASQSKSTTSSATNSGYGARIGEYEKEVDKMLSEIRRRYHGMHVGVV